MQLIKTQPKEIQYTAKTSIQTNALFANNSNLLIAISTNENEAVRHEAVNGIIEIRKNKVHSQVEWSESGLNVFSVTILNWESETFTEIIKGKLHTENNKLYVPEIILHVEIILKNSWPAAQP